MIEMIKALFAIEEGILLFMHKKAKTSTFRCWMKLFWHPKNLFEIGNF